MKKRVFENYRYLVDVMVNDFLGKHPYMRHLTDDLRSGSYVSLLKCLKKAKSEWTEKHFVQYLRKCVSNGCWNVVRAENVIQSPRTHNAKRESFEVTEATAVCKSTECTADLLDSCCLDATDQKIVALCRKRKKVATIASKLKLDADIVANRVKAIRLRFQKAMIE